MSWNSVGLGEITATTTTPTAFSRPLPRLNGYTLVSSELINGLRCACLRKNSDSCFTEDRDAVLAGIGRRTGGQDLFRHQHSPSHQPVRWPLPAD